MNVFESEVKLRLQGKSLALPFWLGLHKILVHFFNHAPHNMNYLKWISKINYKMNVPKVGDILYVILF